MGSSPLRQEIVAQFKRPRGIFGGIAGLIMAHRPSNIRRNNWTVDLLGLEPDLAVLELGCGPGLALLRCAERMPAGRVMGLDHSEVMVRQARRRLSRSIRDGRAEVHLGGVADVASQTRQFDRVFSLNVVQFVPDQAGLFRAIRSCLQPNGMAATTYQPRTDSPSREQAVDMADRVSAAMRDADFVSIERNELPLRPVPAICVTGRAG